VENDLFKICGNPGYNYQKLNESCSHCACNFFSHCKFTIMCQCCFLFQIFIDRDPDLFRIILNFLRTRDVDIHNVNVKSLKREAEFFGIGPLGILLILTVTNFIFCRILFLLTFSLVVRLFREDARKNFIYYAKELKELQWFWIYYVITWKHSKNLQEDA